MAAHASESPRDTRRPAAFALRGKHLHSRVAVPRYSVSMSTGMLVSVEEYLNTTYRPDRDYVGGELIERTVGEHDHGWLQF